MLLFFQNYSNIFPPNKTLCVLVALLAAISISITPALNISNITNKLVNKNYANDSERDKRQIQLYSGMIAKNIQNQLTIMKNEKNIVAERIVKYNIVAKTIKILEDKTKKHLNGVGKEDIEFIKEQIDKLNTANEALELLQLELSDFAINFTHIDYWRIYSRFSQDIESRNVWIKHLQNQYVDSNNNLSDVQNDIRIKIIKNQITVYNNYSNSLISIQDKIIAIKLQEVDADIDALNQKISLQLADRDDTIRVLIDSQIVIADAQALMIEQLDILNGQIEALGVVKEKILETKNETEKFEKVKNLLIEIDEIIDKKQTNQQDFLNKTINDK